MRRVGENFKINIIYYYDIWEQIFFLLLLLYMLNNEYKHNKI